MMFKSDKLKDNEDDEDNKPDGKITKSHDFPKTGIIFGLTPIPAGGGVPGTPLPQPSKRGFYTCCLSPQANLYRTKFIFRPTSDHWICIGFAQMPLKRICTFSVFLKYKFSF